MLHAIHSLFSGITTRGRVEEILNGWNSPQAQLAEQALRSGHIEALINIWENDNFSRYRPEKSVWNLYLLAQLPREMAFDLLAAYH